MNEKLFIDIIGYAASVIIICSMLFKTTTYKGTMIMRTINAIGSGAFIVYGFGAEAYPTAVTNIVALIICLVYLRIEYVDHHRNNNK